MGPATDLLCDEGVHEASGAAAAEAAITAEDLRKSLLLISDIFFDIFDVFSKIMKIFYLCTNRTCIMRNYFLCAAILLSMISCKEKFPDLPIRREGMQLSYGLDSLTFTDWAPLGQRSVKVYYYIPTGGSPSRMPVLFAMHGADRNGLYQVQNWMEVADDKKIIVVSPLLTKEDFPVIEYQYGGVSTSADRYIAVDKELWTYNLIERIFDHIKKNTGNTSERYDLWGHSAGGQFSHRMALFQSGNRIGRVVCSNSGFYTTPDPEGISDGIRTYGFPYSTKDTDLNDEDLKRYFAMDLTVHLGTADTATTAEEDSSLPVMAGAKAQGACRYERGKFFYDTARRVAQEKGFEFNWKIAEVPGVAHNSRLMIQSGTTGAAALLYYQNTD